MPPAARPRYSKRNDGASMLKRIRPERVGMHCPRYFAPVQAALLGVATRAG